MEITFATTDLRDMCEKEEAAGRILSLVAAEALKHRMSDIRAADSIHEVLVGRPRVGDFNGKECFIIDLDEEFQLKVIAAHSKPPLRTDGSADWEQIRRVKVVSLGK